MMKLIPEQKYLFASGFCDGCQRFTSTLGKLRLTIYSLKLRYKFLTNIEYCTYFFFCQRWHVSIQFSFHRIMYCILCGISIANLNKKTFYKSRCQSLWLWLYFTFETCNILANILLNTYTWTHISGRRPTVSAVVCPKTAMNLVK